MATDGFAGKVIKVDLTTRMVEVVDTKPYKQWGGGRGIGTALFWEMCEDKSVLALDPKNVVTITPGRFNATPVASGARTEVQAIGPQVYPVEMFTSSNFGGRWGGMLKLAGYDSIAVVGKADAPVWIDIEDDRIQIRDASQTGDAIWGLDTYDTQDRIWDALGSVDDWRGGDRRDSGRSTQRAAILTIGPAGENLCYDACLIHDGGAGAGQSGFGAVWGSKNLKAISVLGTGSIEIADPAALWDTRAWLKKEYMFDVQNVAPAGPAVTTDTMAGRPGTGQCVVGVGRPEGCMGCHRSCHGKRVVGGIGNGSQCGDSWYLPYEKMFTGAKQETLEISGRAAELIQRLGINAYSTACFTRYLNELNKLGLVGKGKLVDTDLFEVGPLGSYAWAEAMCERLAYRKEVGELLALGPARMGEKLGRYEEDTKSSILLIQSHGYMHHYDGRTEAEYGLSSMVGARDLNDHTFNYVTYWLPTLFSLYGMEPPLSAAKLAEIIGSKVSPYNDPMMIDYSDEGMYSESMVKLVSWHRHYSQYYKASLGLCDKAFASFIALQREDLAGPTPEVEPRLMKSVMGEDLTFERGMELGERIDNFERAILILQGRDRDQEVYEEYMYEVPESLVGDQRYPSVLPVFENGEWSYKNVTGRTVDRDKLETWKSLYYEFKGWDPATGWPTRATLEKMDLAFVADALESAGKLGGAA